ncbi:MAG: thioredoxin family protein [Cyanobacteria bacterium J06600_6]
MISVVNEANFKPEVIEADQPVLVHFWTPWCGLCRLIEPTFKQVLGHSDRSIKLVAINADENLKIANQYRIRNLPTIILFHHGKPINKLDSLGNRERLKTALEELMHHSHSLI